MFEEELLGSRRRKMLNRDFDTVMFEMTLRICDGNSQSIGIFAGNELRRSQLDHN